MSEPQERRGPRLASEEELAEVVRAMRTVAVLGIKGEDRQDESAFSIPAMMQARGFRILPVNPKVTRVLGETAFPTLGHVSEPYDVLDVFRRPDAIPAHVDEIRALPREHRPKLVWLQLGIRDDRAAETLREAVLVVVQDHCLKVAHLHWGL